MLIPQEGEIVTEHERLKPVAVLHTPKGEMVLDFGQEITGYAEFTVPVSYTHLVITYKAVSGEVPVISGGTPITGWTIYDAN